MGELVDILYKEVKRKGLSKSNALDLVELIRLQLKSNKVPLENYLNSFADITIKAVDIANDIFTKNIHEVIEEHIQLMEKYKNVAVDVKKKLMAIGGPEGTIRVYSIRDCSKLKRLEGHKKMVTAMVFHRKGEHLASYCEEERSLRIWTLNASILSFMDKCVTIPVDTYKKKAKVACNLQEEGRYPKLEFAKSASQVVVYFAHSYAYVFTA